jgi:hypothetical protein
MLSSLIALLKALRLKLSERPAPVASEAPAADPRPRCEDPLCGVMEMSYRRDSDKGLETQSVWIRVDTRKLMERILENPDIDLDALQGIERRGSGLRGTPPAAPAKPAPPQWHQKVQRIIQAPPSAAQAAAPRRRIPPPPTHHH